MKKWQKKDTFSNSETERHALPCSQLNYSLNYSLSYRVRGARLSLAGLPALPSQLCPPDWDRASSRSWTAWCGGSQHVCETLKRHGRSLSVVQLRGFVKRSLLYRTTKNCGYTFFLLIVNLVIDENISIFVALYRCCWRLDWWSFFVSVTYIHIKSSFHHGPLFILGIYRGTIFKHLR